MAAPLRTLNDGVGIPAIGFGTDSLRGDAGYGAILSALECGCRLIDSAVNLRNEREVGKAVRQYLETTETPRDEVFVQGKIPPRSHGYDEAMQAYYHSLELTGLDRMDVLLLHSPNYMTGGHREAWRALVELRRTGAVRCIGVSNITAQTLAEIIHDSGVTPAIHQMELHPWLARESMRAEHARLGIVTQSWSPRGSGSPEDDDRPVVEAAAAHSVTPDQAILRWQLQLGNIPLPMTTSREKQRECTEVFGFELTEAEITAISSLSRPDTRPGAGQR